MNCLSSGDFGVKRISFALGHHYFLLRCKWFTENVDDMDLN